MSMLQQGMIFHSLQRPRLSVYHDVLVYRFNFAWEESLFRQALNHLVGKHAILRTIFRLDEARPLQLVIKAKEAPFELVDIRDQDETACDLSLSRWIETEKQRGIDLSSNPWRVCIHWLSDNEFAFGMSFHHALWDGWSNASFVSELLTCYQQLQRSGEIEVGQIPPSYKHFIALEQKALDATSFQDYWQDRFAGARLPWWSGDLQASSIRVACEISPKTSAQLIALARSVGIQEKSLWAGIYFCLLSLLDGNDDVVGSVVVHGRPEIAGSERTLGLFLNSLPIRVDIAGMSWFDLLGTAEAELQTLTALKHFPLIKVQQQTGLNFSASLFNYTNFHVYGDSDADGSINSGSGFEQTNYRFDFHVAKDERQQRFGVFLDADPSVFNEDFRARMGIYVASIIEHMVADSAARIDKAALLTEEERQQQLVSWNNTAAEYPRQRCVHQLFEAEAASNPAAIALVCEGAELSYGELDRRANQLAHYLLSRGVSIDECVGICVERSIAMVVGLLGILKAGACYVPLDPEYPQQRLQAMLANSGIRVVLAQHDLLTRRVLQQGIESTAAAEAIQCVDLDDERLFHDRDASEPAVNVSPANLAYVIYTSGSTGEPKGVAIEHAPLINRIDWMQKRFALTERDRVLQKTPFSFDVSVWEFFWPLVTGATLVMAKSGGHRDPLYLQRTIQRESISVLHFVPSMLNAFLLATEWTNCDSVRQVVSSGEALNCELQERFFSSARRSRLENLYGPTEAVIDVSYWPCSSESGLSSVPIGRPIQNISLYICDASLQPVPTGCAGELMIGGVGLARGYLGKPGLSADCFIPDPFAGQAGARLYRSGDFVRFLADGNIEFIGRIDRQVKIRGFRIDLGEIETVLQDHPAIAEVRVLAREDEAGQLSLVSYIVAEDSAKAKDINDWQTELRRHAEAKLPAWMIPATAVKLDEFPLTANGKLDRRALPAPELLQAAWLTPEGMTESLLAGLWCNLLKLERVGRNDNFFALGAHSLLATQLVSRIREAFAVELPIRVLFEQQSLQAQARAIEAAQPGENGRLSPITAVARDRALPLSFAQQRLWFLSHVSGPNAVYNIPLGLRLQGDVDIDALQKSLAEIVRRHEILRTRFESVETGAVQCIDPEPLHLELEEVDSEAELKAIYRRECNYPFDLSADKLLRLRLLKDQSESHAEAANSIVLIVVMHHSISDGWSLGIFFRELLALYRGYRLGEVPALAPLPIQYGDYACWQRQYLQGEMLAGQVDFWGEQLEGLPPLLALPTDRPRPELQSFRGSFHEFNLPRRLVEQLQALSRKEGATLFMTLLSAFSVLMSRWSGQSDIAIGTPIANRTRQETEGLIGFFVNTLVLRCNLQGDPEFIDLLRQIRERSLQTYAHQDIPFEQLVEVLNPERSLSHSPLFQVMFALQNLPMDSASLPGLDIQPLHFNRETEDDGEADGVSRYDLWLTLHETGDGIRGGMEYNIDLFDRATIVRMLDHYQRLLEAIVSAPHTAVSRLEFLSSSEIQQQIQVWNGERSDYPQSSCIHELFETNAEQIPDSIALWQASGGIAPVALSYSALNKRANQLARCLIGRGVAAETAVAICQNRSPELVVSILACLKAGAAYVPIDANCPQERISYLLDDSGAAMVLGEQALVDRYSQVQQPVFLVDATDARERYLGEVADNVSPEQTGLRPDNLAYIIYTSGSTGQPKGVGGLHRGVVNRVNWLSQTLAPAASDVFCQKTSIGFVDHVAEIFQPLSVGASLVIISTETLQTPSLLHRAFNDWQISHITLVPSLLKAVIGSEYLHAPRMKVIHSSGEALKLSDVAAFRNSFPRARLFNIYGSTEVGADVTAAELELQTSRKIRQGSSIIGRAIANIDLLVLDSHGRLIPAGAVGELHVSGVGLARGYVNRPGLTAEKFVAHPCSEEPGQRLYRSGDLVRFLPDGELDYIGRIDRQVKVRGFRIEVDEIASVVRKHELVDEALVQARECANGETRLVAYIVAGAVQQVDKGVVIDEIRLHVQTQLPAYMIPAAIVILDALPLKPNGKIDLSALPAPDLSAQRADYVAPEGATERVLAKFWCELLNLERVGRFDNFFALGGHSLLAIQLVAMVDEYFHIRLQVAELFKQGTVAGLARRISIIQNLSDEGFLESLTEEEAERLLAEM